MKIMNDLETILNIYTDGACKGNPGIGGWGAILKYGNTIKPKGYKKNGGNKKEQITPQKNSLII